MLVVRLLRVGTMAVSFYLPERGPGKYIKLVWRPVPETSPAAVPVVLDLGDGLVARPRLTDILNHSNRHRFNAASPCSACRSKIAPVPSNSARTDDCTPSPELV